MHFLLAALENGLAALLVVHRCFIVVLFLKYCNLEERYKKWLQIFDPFQRNIMFN